MKITYKNSIDLLIQINKFKKAKRAKRVYLKPLNSFQIKRAGKLNCSVNKEDVYALSSESLIIAKSEFLKAMASSMNGGTLYIVATRGEDAKCLVSGSNMEGRYLQSGLDVYYERDFSRLNTSDEMANEEDAEFYFDCDSEIEDELLAAGIEIIND